MQVSINGTTMAYEDHGAGPAVLLLHGFPFDRSIWKTQIQPLTRAGYRVIAPDLRGFGQGTTSSGNYSLDVLSDDVVGLLNYLGIGRAAMVGVSLGAHVLNTLLKRYPQRVAATVVVDPHHRIDGRAEADNADCLPDSENGKDITRRLLDFLQGVKRFPPRCQLYRQVA
jgi:pimeloyl-ACP methyl ester carboxylesterase